MAVRTVTYDIEPAPCAHPPHRQHLGFVDDASGKWAWIACCECGRVRHVAQDDRAVEFRRQHPDQFSESK